jgi:hypothetical protein
LDWLRDSNLVEVIELAADLNVAVGRDIGGLAGRQVELELGLLEPVGALEPIL